MSDDNKTNSPAPGRLSMHMDQIKFHAPKPPNEAVRIMQAGIMHMEDRAKTHDAPGGERSIGATRSAFEAITGDGLMNTDERAWLFMVLLKLVRSQQGAHHADNYEDAASYCALMGEAALKERGGQ